MIGPRAGMTRNIQPRGSWAKTAPDEEEETRDDKFAFGFVTGTVLIGTVMATGAVLDASLSR